MSKFKSGTARKSSRRQAVPDEQAAHCSTSHFQPESTYGDCDDTSQFIPGSLGGMSPSSRGHTMKECEEQLSQLHKENFNLKLRIYFLEERLGHRGAAMGAGAGEVEALRTELADKQRLLCQAASAIDLVEGKHRDEVRRLEERGASVRAELEGRLLQLQKISGERCQQLQEQVSMQRDEIAQGRQYTHQTSVGTQCCPASAEHDEASDHKIQDLTRELQARGQQVTEAEARIRGLEDALSEKQPEIQIKIQELRERDTLIEEKQNQLDQQSRVLVEIQITLAEKQRLIDALGATIAARDARVAKLEAELGRAKEGAELREGAELSRARAENEMLKTQLRRMNRGGREERGGRGGGGGRSREGVSPRDKALIEEAIEGIWSTPSPRMSPLEEKNARRENSRRPQRDAECSPVEEKYARLENAHKENVHEPQHDAERSLAEEKYARLEREHRRGCEAIQGFVARIKRLSEENDIIRRESRRTENRLRLEVDELRDSYNRAKWEARQLEADATGVPGTLGDAGGDTAEENERLWAEVEDKNKKLAQLSLEMEKQVQTLLTSLKEKESQLLASEARLASSQVELAARDKYIEELKERLSRLQTNDPGGHDGQNGIDADVGLKRSMLKLHSMLDAKLWNKATIDDLQDSLAAIFKKREMEMFSLQHQVEFKDIHLGLTNRDELVPVSFVQHLHFEKSDQPETSAIMNKLSLERDNKADTECDRLRGEPCASEVARRNATDACGLLAGRLEELAGFLVSLLRHPERLGHLDTSHRRYIRQAVQRSVDLSRQLSFYRPDESVPPDTSLDILGRYLEESSPLDEIMIASCSTNTLDRLCEGTDETGERASVVSRLRSQVDALKLEIRQRDIELQCLAREHNLVKLSSPLFDLVEPQTFYGLPAREPHSTTDVDGDSTDHVRLPEPPLASDARQALSESETWSEPDRRISLARIGLTEENAGTRHHHSRTKEPDQSSDSSQETAREANRTPGRRLESRRLQARLRTLEQVNEALRGELAILHQVTPISPPSPGPDIEDNNIVQTTDEIPPIVVPSHLLEQIRRQREKLESSLLHNDFIRRQLEEVILRAKPEEVEEEDVGRELIAVVEGKLRAAEERIVELERKLSEAERCLAESREEARRVVEAEERCCEANRTLLALREEVKRVEERLCEKDEEVRVKEGLVAELEGRVSSQTREIERMVEEMTELRVECDRRVVETRRVLTNRVEDIEREMKRNGDVETELKEAKTNLNEALMQRGEAEKLIEMMKAEFEAKGRAFEDRQRVLEAQIVRTNEESEREMARRSKKLEEAERQLEELRREVERRVRAGGEAEERGLDLRRRLQESEKRYLDQTVAARGQRDEAALAASGAALERARLANERLRLERELRGAEERGTELEADLRAAEGRLDRRLEAARRREAELERRAGELEAANAELRSLLDRPSLGTHSLPRDNGYASGRVWSSDSGRPRSPEPSVRSPLSSLVLQRGFGRQHSEFSDRDTEGTVVTESYWITTVTGSRPGGGSGGGASSPDLGIESDQGRMSSLEANAELRGSADEETSAVQTYRHGRNHNCSAIEEKNAELKRELCKTRRALEETLAQLTASNRRKQNVEKAICKQLEKTNSILMQTRGNLQLEHLMLCEDQT